MSPAVAQENVAIFRNLNVVVTASKPLPKQDAMSSACRIDVTLRCDEPFVAADMHGYTDKSGFHPALCSPLTNLQRFLIANGR